jgi:hypothetical protein
MTINHGTVRNLAEFAETVATLRQSAEERQFLAILLAPSHKILSLGT